MSALSRQIEPPRKKVDRIDLKMLQLLQQRTKLSGQIGRVTRRLGAVIYVPERERDLLARLVRSSKGRLPAKAVVALYREILSHSRSEQQQPPIGFLQASAGLVLPAAHAAFGACDQFLPRKTWPEVAKGLRSPETPQLVLVSPGRAVLVWSDRIKKAEWTLSWAVLPAPDALVK